MMKSFMAVMMMLLLLPTIVLATSDVKEANSWRTEWQCNDSIVNHECTVKLCNVDLWSILSGSRTFETALSISDTSFAGAPSYQIYSWQNASHDAVERKCEHVKQECKYTEAEIKLFNKNNTKVGDAYDCSYDDCKDIPVKRYYGDWAPLKSDAGGYEKIRDDTLGYSSCENYKVIYQTPVTNVNGAYGSTGKIAFIDETTDIEYHPWWNSTWLYYKNATITEAAGDNITNGITDVWLTHANKVMSDCSDIRVVSPAGTETKFYATGCNSTHAHVYMQYNVTASSTAVYSIYYGNTSAVTSTSQASFGAARTGGDSDLFKEEDGSASEWLAHGTSTGGAITTDNPWKTDGSYSLNIISGTTGMGEPAADSYGMCYDINSTSGFTETKHPISLTFDFTRGTGAAMIWQVLGTSSRSTFDTTMTQPIMTYNILYIMSTHNTWGAYLGTQANAGTTYHVTMNTTDWTAKTTQLYLNDTYQNSGGGDHNNFANTTDTFMSGDRICQWRNGGTSMNGTFDNGTLIFNTSYALGSEESPPTPLVITIESPTNSTYNVTSVWQNATLNVIAGADQCWAVLDGAVNSSLSNNSGNWNRLELGMAHGAHNSIVYCNDSTGYEYASSKIYYTVNLTTPMAIAIAYPTNVTYPILDIWQNATVNVTAGISQCIVQVDSTNHTMSNTSGNWNHLVTLAQGGHNSKVLCQDTVGIWYASSTVYYSIVLPPQPLAIAIQSPVWFPPYFTTGVWWNITLNNTSSGCVADTDSGNQTLSNDTAVHYYYQKPAWNGHGPHNVQYYCFDLNNATVEYNSTQVFYTVNLASPLDITVVSPVMSSIFSNNSSTIWWNITVNSTAQQCWAAKDGINYTMISDWVNISWHFNNSTAEHAGQNNITFYCNESFGTEYSEYTWYAVASGSVLSVGGMFSSITDLFVLYIFGNVMLAALFAILFFTLMAYRLGLSIETIAIVDVLMFGAFGAMAFPTIVTWQGIIIVVIIIALCYFVYKQFLAR